MVTVFISLALSGWTISRYSNAGIGAAQGAILFQMLSVVAFLFSSFAGVFICSDCLSREKRDGTLGLLFLTDLRPIDVVFGKFCAFGLNLFYGLLAFVPILAMTLQIGGITPWLVFKTVLVLLNCLFLSIAIVTFVSSISKDERKALWASVGMLLLIFVGPYVLIEYLAPDAIAVQYTMIEAFLVWVSPLTSLDEVTGGIFRRSSILSIPVIRMGVFHFWISLLVPHLLAWFLLYRSGRAISKVTSGAPRSLWWEEICNRWHYFLYGRGEQRRAHRQLLLDHHPMTWMVMREKLKLKYVWTLVISVMFIWVIGFVINGEIMAESTVLMSLGIFVHFFLKVWVASEAASVIAEDRRTGALELVVTTPLGARGIIKGIFKATLLQFWKPVCLLIVAEILLVCTIAAPGRNQDLSVLRYQYLAAIGMLVVDMASIGWVAIWFALKTGSSHKAIGRSIVWMLALPWVFYAILQPFWGLVWHPLYQMLLYEHGDIMNWAESGNIMRPYYKTGNVILWCLIGLTWNYWYAWHHTRKRVLSQFQTLVSESNMEKKS